MGKKKKEKQAADAPAAEATAPAAAPPDGKAPPEPAQPSSAPLPLAALPPDFLGAFFELCFPDKRLVELCREQRITTPGYRLEALPPQDVAMVLAEEFLAAEDVRPPLEKAVRMALRNPALEPLAVAGALTVEHLESLLELLVGDAVMHCARVAWSALLAQDPKVREHARVAIQDGLETIDALAKQHDEQRKKVRGPPPGEKEAVEAVKRAERAERETEGLRAQLAQARAETAQREQRLAEQRGELEQARGEAARATAELARLNAAGEGRSLVEARRLSDENRALGDRLARGEESRAALEAEVARLEAALRAEEAQRAAGPAPAAPPEDALPSEEEASSFLLPIFTREFYDSVVRWDRRMQRAALDKIHKLALDWRHGSLRALQLEGVPGYYRIRVATDVRLIYRRDGGRLEILSLIDREDLDRYVRQARTRPG